MHPKELERKVTEMMMARALFDDLIINNMTGYHCDTGTQITPALQPPHRA
jgi:hypothetical protein